MKKATQSRRMTRIALASAALAITVSIPAKAADSDTMTNIATVPSSCSVVAVGVDFGDVNLSAGLPAVITPNANDGGTLSLLGIDVPLPTANAGVHVICTKTPANIILSSPNAGADTTINTSGGDPSVINTSFASKMVNTTDATKTIDYSLGLIGASFSSTAVTSLVTALPTAYVGTIAATGSIGTGQTYAEGDYEDDVDVQVNF